MALRDDVKLRIREQVIEDADYLAEFVLKRIQKGHVRNYESDENDFVINLDDDCQFCVYIPEVKLRDWLNLLQEKS